MKESFYPQLMLKMQTIKFSRGEKLRADKEQVIVDLRLDLSLKLDLDVDLDRGFQDTKKAAY